VVPAPPSPTRIEQYGKSLFGNRLVRGDNLALLQHLMATGTKIDLVYIDPPFATGDTFEFETSVAFEDQWAGGVPGFLDMMLPRLRLIREVLSPTGSLLLHCDFRTSHYLGALCDEVFGPGDRGTRAHQPGFRNEIIWSYGLGGSSPRCYPKKHDVIFWYTKSSEWYFEPPRIAATSAKMKGMQKKATDVWDIPSINNMARERTGYPTQKPEILLRRIIESHSRKGDLVADFFAGSGTTLAVAQHLGRHWVGCDNSAIALHVARKRLLDEDATFDVLRFTDDDAPDTQPPFAPKIVHRNGHVAVMVPATSPIDFWAVDWNFEGIFAPAFHTYKRRAGHELVCETPMRGTRDVGRIAVKGINAQGAEKLVELSLTDGPVATL
jgi:DNA modification methylase